MPLVTAVKIDVDALAKKVKSRYEDPRVRFQFTIPEKDGHLAHRVVTVEDLPRVFTASYRHDGGGDEEDIDTTDFRIKKPYSYINFHFYPSGGFIGAQIYFSYSQIKSIGETRRMFFVPLPNVAYGENDAMIEGICFGRHTFPGKTIEERALFGERHFWASLFNDEIPVSQESWPGKWPGCEDSSGISGDVFKAWDRKTRRGTMPRFVRSHHGSSILSSAKFMASVFRNED